MNTERLTKFLAAVVEAAEDGVIVIDSNMAIIYANEGAERMFGYPSDEILGKPLDILLPERHRAGHEEFVLEFGESSDTSRRMGQRRTITGQTKAGDEFPAQATIVKLGMGSEAMYAAIVRDVTQEQLHLQQVEHMARTDALTGLANRREFFERAGHEFGRFRRYGHPAALLIVDIDHFKAINDTYGHGVGDDSLQRLANVLRSSFRSTDVIGRLGGEEFAIMMLAADESIAHQLGERFRRSIEALKISTESAEFGFTVSIGASCFSRQDETVDITLARADRALYAAKNGGRNRLFFGDAENEDRSAIAEGVART